MSELSNMRLVYDAAFSYLHERISNFEEELRAVATTLEDDSDERDTKEAVERIAQNVREILHMQKFLGDEIASQASRIKNLEEANLEYTRRLESIHDHKRKPRTPG